MKNFYVKTLYKYARLLHPDFPNNAIVYLRQEPTGMLTYLCMERQTDTDLIFHPVQKWLKGLIDSVNQLTAENQNLKEQLTKLEEEKKK
jgi:hypothetical protein